MSGLCYPCVNYKIAKLNGAEKTEKANMVDEDKKNIPPKHESNQIKIDILTGRVKHHCNSCGIEVKKLLWERHTNRNEGEKPIYALSDKWMVNPHGLLLCLECRKKDDIKSFSFCLFSLTSGQNARS